MKNLMFLLLGVVLALVTAFITELAPMIVPAMLFVIAGVVIVDAISEPKRTS